MGNKSKSKKVRENSPESITYEKTDERDEKLEEEEKPNDDCNGKDSPNDETEESKENEQPQEPEENEKPQEPEENEEPQEPEENEKELDEPEENNQKPNGNEDKTAHSESDKDDTGSINDDDKQNDSLKKTSTKKKKNQKSKKKGYEDVTGEELPPGILDQPIKILENKRSRKELTKYDNSKDVKTRMSINDIELDYSLGKGVLLKQIPFIKYQIQIAETEDLIVLHKLMYRKPGKISEIKHNIRNFCGFPFDEKTKNFIAAKSLAGRITAAGLKFLNGLLGLEVSKDGLKMEQDLIEFLKEPKDLGLEVPETVIIEPRKSMRKVSRRGRKNPKRNRGVPKGYAMVSDKSEEESSDEGEDDNESDEEKPATRRGRSKSSKKSQKKSKKKDSDDEESSADEKTPPARKTPSRSKNSVSYTDTNENDDDDGDDDSADSEDDKPTAKQSSKKTKSNGTKKESDSEEEEEVEKPKSKKTVKRNKKKSWKEK